MFKKNNKNNEEVIRMEQTTFIQRHAKKILIVGGIVVAGGVYYMLGKHEKEMKDVLADNALLRSFMEEDGKAISKLTEDNKTLMTAASEGLFEEAISKVTNKINYRLDRKEYLEKALEKCPEDMDLKVAYEKIVEELTILFVRRNKFEDAQALFEIKDLDK